MRVRLATADDAVVMAEIYAAVAGEGRWIAGEPPVDLAARAERFREIVAGDARMWALEDDAGRVVGHLVLRPSRVGGVADLGMVVLAEARGHGGGRALMDAALAWAQANADLHKIELEVWPDNGRAIALYTRCGFEIEGLRRDHYRRRDGSLRSALLMARLLQRS